jgi:hypothetical protein
MKFIIALLLLICVIQNVSLQGCGPNEEYTVCGNLCEDSCDNTCDPSIYQPFSSLTAANGACVAGCYCKEDYIRDDNGDCVKNKPFVCGNYYII